MAGRDVKFKVKLLDQSVQELELDAFTVCSDVKLVLEALTNIPATRQRLIYRGRVLRDDSSLQELGIEDGHTIHLIEREAPAPGANAGANAGRAGATGAQGPDLNRLLQGVFSALGGLGQPPTTTAAAAAAAAGAAPAQALGPEPVHLLQSIASFLQQLQADAGAGADVAMPVTSLALGGTTGSQQLQNSLTTALHNILSGQALAAGQQAQLAAATSAAAAGGAAAGAGTYPHMQLVLAALGLLLTRAQAYLTGPVATGLAQGAQQLASLAQQQGLNTAEASQALTRVSGQLQSAAALLVELARAASASSVEVQGSNPLLTANTAAVLQQAEGPSGRLTPAFPTLYPQLPPGLGGDRNTAGRPVSVALPDFSNPADVLQFAGRLTNTVLTGLGTNIAANGQPGAGAGGAAAAAAGGGAAPAADAAAAGAASSAQVAQMVAAALTSSLAPVIERVSADVAGVVRTGRGSISSGQFQNASTTAATIAAQTVSGTVGRVLTSVSETLNRNLSGIEQRLQDVERESGRQANAIDIAAAVQQVLLPHMQPLGDVLGAAARAAASSAAAANQAAATAATAAQEAANAAATAGQAAAAAAATPAASAPPAPPATAAAAAAAVPSAPAAAAAGPSSSDGSQPRGLGLGTGLRSGALPAKRKAQGAAGSDSPAAEGAAAGAAGSSAAAAGGGSSGTAAARPAAAAAGAAGRGAPPPDLGALMQMMMGGGGGQQQQQQQQRPAAAGGMGGGAAGGGGDLSGLMQMMGGMLGGGGPGGGGGGGGMGGLLQMAGQIASDPAMQPLISGMANAVLGGGGPGGGQGMGGLGGLLGGLLGASGPGGMGGPGGSGARSATVVASMDDLEHELPADVAAEWRRVLEEDERAQAISAAQGRDPLSEVYQAGAPTAGRRSLIPGLPV